MELSTEVITIGSLVANAVLVGIVILQYVLSVQQYETINRPWLVLKKMDNILIVIIQYGV